MTDTPDAQPDPCCPWHAASSAAIAGVRGLHRDESGATSTEYLLILTLVVLPIAMLYPLFMRMVKTYGGRMTSTLGLPFP